MLVQPTISHFVKNSTKTQPILKPKQETTSSSSRQEHVVKNFDSLCDVTAALSAQEEFKTRAQGSANKNQSQLSHEENKTSSNPFAKAVVKQLLPSGEVTTELSLQLKVKPEHEGHKALSLKVRKRKHRTISVSPQNAEDYNKKVCRALENENVQPSTIVPKCLNISRDNLNHSEKVEAIKIHGTRKIPCEFSMEEEALMGSYALDSDQTDAKKLALADLDIDKHLSSVNTPLRNQTSKDHLNKMNRSSSRALTIPCSPSFSPRRPMPKAFSPFLERTRVPSQSASDCVGGDDLSVNGQAQTPETNGNLNSSAVLFSTPVECPRTASPQSLSGSVPRRALFSTSDKHMDLLGGSLQRVNKTLHPSTMDPTQTRSTSLENDFSFINDISLSEFADVSRVEMEEGTYFHSHQLKEPLSLNRHLVLEVTSQECNSEDALLCTGRYSMNK